MIEILNISGTLCLSSAVEQGLICSTADEGYIVSESSIFVSFHYYMSSNANQLSEVNVIKYNSFLMQ